MSQQFVEIAVDVPLLQAFSYRVPDALVGRLRPGHMVHVPWRHRSRSGVVLSVEATPPAGLEPEKLKAIQDLIDPEPVVAADIIALARFIAQYYRAPIGEAIALAIPAGLRRDGVRRFRLTEAGRAAMKSAELSQPLQQAMGVLAGQPKGMLGPALVQKSLRYWHLDQAVEQGWLEVDYILSDAKVKVVTETWVKLAEPLPDLDGYRLGSKQKLLVDALKQHACLAMSALRRLSPSARGSLRPLAERGLVRFEEREVIRDPMLAEPITPAGDYPLSEEQQAALEAISRAEGYAPFLLHGVTGSGKTEVYIQAIHRVLAQGKSALVLVPEIALTPQACSVFRGHFKEEVAVLHSGLTEGQRFDAWRRLRAGEARIAIGARSALFAPLPKLGIIVVDEEHDSSFKQGESPRYHARDMALVRGRANQAKVVLGSATPSLEAYELARLGRVQLLKMEQRVGSRGLPGVEIIDMRGQRQQQGGDQSPSADRGAPEDPKAKLIARTLSETLRESLSETLARGEQAIIFLNRRGHSTFVQCAYCGFPLYCPHCSVSLTYHQRSHSLQCHYCDFTQAPPANCPQCGRPDLGLLGVGTEQLTEILAELYPHHVVARLDRDIGSTKKLRKLLDRFRHGQIDILVGTQMVAKGHDIHNVTLVGVVLADLGLNFPDFRASERTFQLLAQVAGRAGRGAQAGRVIIQTLSPEHPALIASQHHDYGAFVKGELELRRQLAYPPFGHLILLRSEAQDPEQAEEAADMIGRAAYAMMPPNVIMLGPAKSPLGRLRGRSRYQIIFKSSERSALRQLVERVLGATEKDRLKRTPGARLVVDIDPQDLL